MVCVGQRSAGSYRIEVVQTRLQIKVSAGHLTPSEAAEIGKVIEIYVKAYQTAELDDRIARVEQLSDEELMRIIRKGESTPPRLLTIGSD